MPQIMKSHRVPVRFCQLSQMLADDLIIDRHDKIIFAVMIATSFATNHGSPSMITVRTSHRIRHYETTESHDPLSFSCLRRHTIYIASRRFQIICCDIYPVPSQHGTYRSIGSEPISIALSSQTRGSHEGRRQYIAEEVS